MKLDASQGPKFTVESSDATSLASTSDPANARVIENRKLYELSCILKIGTTRWLPVPEDDTNLNSLIAQIQVMKCAVRVIG